MSGNSKIEWTGATWNPIRARLKEDTRIELVKGGFKIMPAGTWGYHCERVSPGCQNCYACNMNGRTLPAWGTGLDYTVPNRNKVDIYLDEEELLKPLHWKKPRMIFPCSMTDLFAEFVPDWMINKMFAVMSQTPEHKYQVLTRRAVRLPEFIGHPDREDWVDQSNGDLGWRHANTRGRWPLPNVWLGVSIEDQQRADERVPHLLATPAAIRWVSYEPALGPVDFFSYMPCAHKKGGCRRCRDWEIDSGIDWIVCGGESGPVARTLDLQWARDVIEQCAAASVPCFVKQLGRDPREGNANGNCRNVDCTHPDCGHTRLKLKDRKGGDPAEWPEWARVREMPEARP